MGDVAAYLPTPSRGFGSVGRSGFERKTISYDGRPAVVTTFGVGRLQLTAGLPCDRTITIVACLGPGADGDTDSTFVLELAGQSSDLGQLTDDWQTFSVDVPVDRWQEGTNSLLVKAGRLQSELGVRCGASPWPA